MHDISPQDCLIEFVYPALNVDDALSITLLARLDELIVLSGVVIHVEGDFARVAFEGLDAPGFERLSFLLED